MIRSLSKLMNTSMGFRINFQCVYKLSKQNKIGVQKAQNTLLQQMSQKLISQKQYFSRPLSHTHTHHYTSYLSRSICVSSLPSQQKSFYFRLIKRIIKSSPKLYNPQTLTSLMQDFYYFQFDGNQSEVLDNMIRYVEDNFYLFSQAQFRLIIDTYRKIMVEKAVGTVKFRPIVVPNIRKSQSQKKIHYIKQLFVKNLSIPSHRVSSQFVYQQKTTRKWLNFHLPLKNMHILSIPDIQNIQTTQMMDYCYELKKTIQKCITRNKKSNKSQNITILLIEGQEINQIKSQQILQQINGIVYRRKVYQSGQNQSMEQLRNYSLKQEIQKKMRIKKEKKLKEKLKSRMDKQDLTHNKSQPIDFVETLKYQVRRIKQSYEQKSRKYAQNKKSLQPGIQQVLNINLSLIQCPPQSQPNYILSHYPLPILKQLYSYLSLISFHSQYQTLASNPSLTSLQSYPSLISFNQTNQTKIRYKYLGGIQQWCKNKDNKKIMDQIVKRLTKDNNAQGQIVIIMGGSMVTQIFQIIQQLKDKILNTKRLNHPILTQDQTKLKKQLVKNMFK